MNQYDFSSYKDLPVLLTGASGFTGGHLAKRLTELGSKLSLLVRDPENQQIQKLQEAGARLIVGDLRNKEVLNAACAGQAIVFHIAALFREAKHEDKVYFDVNLQGSKNTFEASYLNQVKRVVYCSTNGVHGSVDQPPGNEDSPIRPGDVYQESKVQAELAAQERVRQFDQDITIIRPAMIWGEGDKRFLKMFKAVSRRRFPIIGTGQSLCHWIYVQELVDAFLLAGMLPAAKGRTYLIAGNEIVTLEDTLRFIAEQAGVKLLPFKIPAWPILLLGSLVETLCIPLGIEPPIHKRRVNFFVKNRAFDISRARTELGFEPRMPVKQQAENIFKWYKEKGWL